MRFERVQLVRDFLTYLWQRYQRDGCRESAAALTYMSLFAVVPLLTMMYAMFSLVPAFQGLGDQVQSLIFENFVPESGTEIQSYLVEFSSQARKLSAAGVVILAVTSYLMLSNIEKTFNKIWGTPGSRRGLSSFMLYWGVLSLGPLLLGMGLMMQTYLVSFQLMVDEVDALGLLGWVFGYLPLLMTCVAFTLLFVAVPNCRVSVRDAIYGGLVTTALFELAKWSFGLVIASSNYASIYGAFAFFPIFLVWLYLCWMIVLGGAEFVRSLETFGTFWRKSRYPDLVVILVVLWTCWKQQRQGGSITDRDMLRAGINEQHWRRIRDLLIRENYLAVTVQGRYVLIRDVSELSLWQLGEVSNGDIVEMPSDTAINELQQYPWFGQLQQLLQSANNDVKTIFAPKVSELFAGANQNKATLKEVL